MKRLASITQLKPEKVEEYKELHANAWPRVLRMIESSKITNYSIFWKEMTDGTHYLFSYFEYTGDDFEADMDRMAADEETQRWWAVCKPCLIPIEDLPQGETWSPMTQVFYNP